MDEADFLGNARVAIIGLGLIGGSLALGLQGHCREILAVDSDPDTLERATREKVANQVSNDLAHIVPQADLIILATPVNIILDIIPQLPLLHPGKCIVLDLGSTKEDICRQLNTLPERFDALGGHPMCGKANGGLANAEAALFRGAPFAFTPLPGTTDRALQFADQLAQILGARPIWVGPKTHDTWVASTSHLPYILATALVLATETEASHLVGPGFRSTSRLAGSPSSVMLPILENNREQVLQAIKEFQAQLSKLESLLTKEDYDMLKDKLDYGARHKALLTGI